MFRSLSHRLELTAGLLSVGLFVQLLLFWHLGDVATPFPELKKKIHDLPALLTEGEQAWYGNDDPQTDAIELPYRTEEILHRFYRQRDSNVQVEVFALYSREGDDRMHHPEVCIRDVGGAPEDRAARKLIPLGRDGKRQAIRFRFLTGPNQVTTVYYWHYTFPVVLRDGQTWLQVLHQTVKGAAPSISFLVASNASLEALADVERSLLPRIDREMNERHLPDRCLIGTDRLPIGVIRK